MSPETFKSRFPHLSGYEDTLIGDLIEDAKLETPLTAWGKLRDRGIKLLVAHWLTLDQQSSTEVGGGLALIDQGKQPRYESKTNSLNSTRYGLEYMRLRKSVLGVIGARMT